MQYQFTQWLQDILSRASQVLQRERVQLLVCFEIPNHKMALFSALVRSYITKNVMTKTKSISSIGNFLLTNYNSRQLLYFSGQVNNKKGLDLFSLSRSFTTQNKESTISPSNLFFRQVENRKILTYIHKYAIT